MKNSETCNICTRKHFKSKCFAHHYHINNFHVQSILINKSTEVCTHEFFVFIKNEGNKKDLDVWQERVAELDKGEKRRKLGAKEKS